MSASGEAGNEVFGEDDLLPGDEERRALRLAMLDRVAVVGAVLALGLLMGGMISLGTCAAPFVFRLTPHPFSGHAMGAAFSRFDAIAIGCTVVALGCEVARTVIAMRRRQGGLLPRIRRYLAIALALGAVYGGLQLSPQIMKYHAEGVRRGVGEAGAALESTHKAAEFIAKANVSLAALLMALHILTLRGAFEEDEEIAAAPRPPGPLGKAAKL